jgi:(5-formylfuran-3-yl)methyl phosphate synthase
MRMKKDTIWSRHTRCLGELISGEAGIRQLDDFGETEKKGKTNMQVLISPVSYEEAASILDTGVDIIDVKNVNEGSLGAQFPWHTRKVVDLTRNSGVKTSATLGDLPYKPGTAALAAYGAAMCGVTYIKAGLYGTTTYDQACEVMDAVRRAVRMVGEDIDVVASGYADYRRFNGLSTTDLVRVARDTNCTVVMVDTAIKDGKNLFAALSFQELREFVEAGHAAGLRVALAGSIKSEHTSVLLDLDPDIIGVRGAVCEGVDRKTRISPEKTKRFVSMFHTEKPATQLAV